MPEVSKTTAPAKTRDVGTRRTIAEWLRHAQEVDELLVRLGGEVSEDPKESRKRLLALVRHEPPEVVAAQIYALASGFAAMLDDIVDACARWGISISGEMLLGGNAQLGRSSALDTEWAQDAKGDAVLTGTGSLFHIADQLRAICGQLAGASLLRTVTREEQSAISRDFADSPDPLHRLLATQRLPGMRQIHEEQGASTHDLSGLRACAELTAQLQHVARTLRVAPLSDALSQLLSVIRTKQHDLDQAKPLNAASSPAVLSLLGTLRELASKLPSVARQKVRAKRALRGMGTFVRSEYWPSRWRIYEVWVFIRCLRTIERAGLQLDFLGMLGDVWQLHYGQNAEPVVRATTEDSALVLDVYYQLFDRGTSSSSGDQIDAPRANAMPDIAAKRPDGRYAFVVDPKHGPSHRLSKVQQVLDRYGERFKADVTAVVNYTNVPQYLFTKNRREGIPLGEAILASGLTPGSVATRRLELSLEEAILNQLPLTTRFNRDSTTASKPAARRISTLVYWATAPSEVDEPSGAWALESAGELRYLAKLSEAIGEHKEVRSFATNPQGTRLFLASEKHLLLASSEGIQKVELGSHYGSIEACWCRCGEHVLAMTNRHFRVLNSVGDKLADLPRVSGDLAIAWSDDCNTIYAIDSSWSVGMARVDAPEVGWKQFRQPGSSYGKPRAVFDSSRSAYFVEGHGSRLDAHSTLAYLVQGSKPELKVDAAPADPLWAVSPTGDRRLVRGPKSLNYPTSILKVIDGTNGDQVGPNILAPSDPEGDVQWSHNGDRFAFLAKRQVYVCAPGERYGMPIAMYRHRPSGFGWFDASLMKRWG